ncbi:MAG: FAD-dependent oxidoreductase, partial [Planctomycetota bacterium]
MKRRKFLQGSVGAIGFGGMVPLIAQGAAPVNDQGERIADRWYDVETGRMRKPVRRRREQYDVAVIGGGMAGVCAAIASARNGAKTVLVQDRPVLGGNASSEIRVNVNGARRKGGFPERETGIIEEILLANRFYNPQESYSVWDHVIYDLVVREPLLTVMLNTQAIDAVVDGDVIRSAVCWQGTTETELIIDAKYFIDCSGDGLLAAAAGATYRTGREARSEFNEQYAPEKADGWQMGASILLHGRDMGRPIPYTPPSFAIKYDPSKANKRTIKTFEDGYWWVELGSDDDIIADYETIRHKLL